MRIRHLFHLLAVSLIVMPHVEISAKLVSVDWIVTPQTIETTPPVSGVEVWQSDQGDESARAELSEKIGQSGTLQFWFQTKQDLIPSREAERTQKPLIELPGLLDVSLRMDPSEVTLFIEWAGDEETMFERHIRMIIPSLPGSQWIHFALTWDADAGLYNALLNGTPFYTPGVAIEPIQQGLADTIVPDSGKTAIAGLELTSTYTEVEALRARLEPDVRDSLEHLMGSQRLEPFDIESQRGRLLYANAMDHPDRVQSWTMEGPGILSENDGWLHLKSERPDGPQGHMVFWCPEDFPDSFIAEWEFILEDAVGLCIVFFAATGPEGQSIFASDMSPRSGEFGHYVYSDLHAYHISYYASTPWVPRSMANLRKNPGLHLLGNGPIAVRAESGKIYRAQLVKDGPHIRMSIDGHTIIDEIDSGERFGEVYSGGKIGLRQMQWTEARYRNFAVYELNPPR